MFFFTAGPWNTMSRSFGVRSLNGTSVRTPIARATSFMIDHISVCHGSTAPSSIVRLSSGTRVDSSTVRTMPVPSQVGQAPRLLNARSSAPGAVTGAPHSGQTMGFSKATFMVGST